MELKLKVIKLRQLLPILSFASLATSVVIAGLTITLAPTTETVLLANQDIAEGQEITEDLLTTKQLSLSSPNSNYLTQLEPNTMATRSISRGELIAKTLVTTTVDQRIPIRLNDLQPISQALNVGDHVDIWATENNQGQTLQPQLVAIDAIILKINESNSLGQSNTSVEVRISPEYLESLLATLGTNFQITLVLQETLADIQ